jgi:hypothetical protein
MLSRQSDRKKRGGRKDTGELTDKGKRIRLKQRRGSGSTPDPVGVFLVEVGIFNKGEEIDRSFHPKEKDPFQENPNQATGSEEAMEQDEIHLNEKGQGEESRE